MKKYLFLFVFSLLLIACSSGRWVITNTETQAIPIDATLDELADTDLKNYIVPIKEMIDKDMDQVIGYASEKMARHLPESLLSNWSADIYLQSASEFNKSQIDMAVVNMGSLRTAIEQGDITVGDIFRLMPFENELVILWLKGSEIKKLLDIFAKEGGQAVAGVSMEIKDGKAQNSKIQGKAIEDDTLYSIATNDFLAGGNDRMLPLASPEKRIDTHLKIRNILMEYVIRNTKEGKNIESKLDGRIKLVE